MNYTCFACRLPDCDMASRFCRLRMARNRCKSLREKKQDVPEEVRLGVSEWREMQYLEERAKQSEMQA